MKAAAVSIGVCAGWGALVLARSGLPTGRLALHIGALALGLVVLAVAARLAPRRGPLLGALATAALALPLLFPGLDGVHRWLVFGPLRLHASALVAPLVVFAISALLGQGRPLGAAGLAFTAQALHALQPDAGQATSLALACVALALTAGGAPGPRAALALVAALPAFVAWTRPDPLLPVPEVEGALALAAALGPGTLAVSLLALVALPLPGLAARTPAGPGLAAYLAGTILAPALGAFPVPALGWGASPILGTCLALGLASLDPRPPLRASAATFRRRLP